MNSNVCKVLRLVVAVLLAGCAGQTEQLSMQQPAQRGAQPPPPQAITFPNGTTFRGASGRQASKLAQIIVEANNNNMHEYQQLQSTENKNLQTSQQALQNHCGLSNRPSSGGAASPAGLAMPNVGVRHAPMLAAGHRL
jgi:hypothetical protein